MDCPLVTVKPVVEPSPVYFLLLKDTLPRPPISDNTKAPVLVFITPLSATKNLSVSEPAAMLPKEIAIDIESSVVKPLH